MIFMDARDSVLSELVNGFLNLMFEDVGDCISHLAPQLKNSGELWIAGVKDVKDFSDPSMIGTSLVSC